MHRSILPVFAVFVAACSNEETPNRTPSVESEWSMLIEESWTLPPGGEATDWCKKVTLEEDVFVSAIRPVHPLGTHHTFLALSDTADGERCTTAVGTGGLIYAAGLGSQGLELPEGVAMHFTAGQVLNLSLHLYNVSDRELPGTSGIQVVRMDPAEVVHESGPMLAGPVDISIPPGRHTLTHECEITEPQTAYAIFPHMHQLGVHFKTTITAGGTPIVLHDADYDFREQVQLPMALDLGPGDRIKTECTYENPGAETVTFGESSDTEMCFTVLFRYPRVGGGWCRRITP